MVAGARLAISLLISVVISTPIQESLESHSRAAAVFSGPAVVQATEVDSGTTRSTEQADHPEKHTIRAGSNWTRLSIALEPEDPALLERTLLEISNPSSKRYGHHLTAEQAKDLLKPRKESFEAIEKWMRDVGVDVDKDSVNYDGQWVHVDLPEDEARGSSPREALNRRGRGAGFELPLSVRKHVALVRRSSAASTIHNHRSSVRSKDHEIRAGGPDTCHEHRATSTVVDFNSCKKAMTPTCLKALYHVKGNELLPNKRSLFGIVGFDEQAAQYKELKQFVTKFAPYAANAGFSVDLVNNGTNVQSNDSLSGEANSDVQYGIALAYDVPVRFYSVGGEDHDFIPDLDLTDTATEAIEPFLQFALHLLSLPDAQLPQTVSISYGINEQLVPPSYAHQVCTIFGQLGARGVSILVGSGDLGPGASCVSNGNAGDAKKGKPRFLPAFPATCSYVTAVGGTMIGSVEGSKIEQQGVSFSSGGFSDYFSRPSWQAGDVQPYLKNLGNKFKGLYNNTGRAFPDIAAHSVDLQYFNHGMLSSFDGTSASAPIMASLIARLNDQRLRAGKKPLGFLNPWIYSKAKQGFVDVLVGTSVGCQGTTVSGATAPVIPGAGWAASKGWDAITGLGTPDFDKLTQLV